MDVAWGHHNTTVPYPLEGRVSTVPLDPRDVEIIADALYARLYGTFGPLHSNLAQCLRDVCGEVARLHRRADTIQRQLHAVEREVGLMRSAKGAYADLAAGQTHSMPTPGMERPIEIDRACAAVGTDNAKPAVIPEYGNLVIYPKPGYSPAEVHDDVVQSIEAARTANTRGGDSVTTGLRRPHRAKKR
jgi:hypothetical protein